MLVDAIHHPAIAFVTGMAPSEALTQTVPRYSVAWCDHIPASLGIDANLWKTMTVGRLVFSWVLVLPLVFCLANLVVRPSFCAGVSHRP